MHKSNLRQNGACVGHLSNFMFRQRRKGCSSRNKSESWRVQSTRSCMMSLEHNQLLPTAPEVSFEVSITRTCFLLTSLCSFCTLSIVNVGSYIYCCILIPVSFPLYCSHGYEATELNSYSMCDVDSGIHHVIILTRPCQRHSYCKQQQHRWRTGNEASHATQSSRLQKRPTGSLPTCKSCPQLLLTMAS